MSRRKIRYNRASKSGGYDNKMTERGNKALGRQKKPYKKTGRKKMNTNRW